MAIYRKKLTISALGLGALCTSLFSSHAVAGWDPNAGLPSQAQAVPKYIEGEVLVKFREKVSDADIDAAERAAGLKKGTKFKSNDKHMKRWRHFTGKQGQTTEELVTVLKKNPNVEWAEPNYIVTAQQFPNDPRFSELWGMNNTGQTGGTNDADIDAPEAWDTRTTSSKVVAVIDTGVDYNHPDLAANMWHNPGEIAGNGIDDDANGYVDDVYGRDFVNNDSDPMDDHGHGTHVSGTIGAVGNNGVGVAGVNWSVKIMALKFLNAGGSGSTSAAISAVNYATQMGAKISNNSWGGGSYSQALYDAIKAANTAGALFVAAAGNNGSNTDSGAYYPAGYLLPNVIAVAATDHNDARASFSNYGVKSVDLGAPGVSILSTVPTATCTLCDPSGYKLLNGTSMATPHVAGAVALAWEQRPTLTNAQVKARLLETVDPIPALAGITVTGGRLNANKFLTGVQYDLGVVPTLQEVLHGNSVDYTLTFSSVRNVDVTLQLSTGTLDAGLSASFANSTLLLPANGNASTTLTVSAGYGMQRGNHSVPVLVSDGTVTLPITPVVDVRVPSAEFTVKQPSPTSKLLVRGESKEFPVTVRSVDDYSGTVGVSASVADPTMNVAVAPGSFYVPSGGSVEVMVTVTSSPTTSIGDHSVTVSATANGVVRDGTVIANVRDATVCPSGCAYNTIQAAVNAAATGAFVVVKPATYYERVSIAKAVTVVGTDKSNTVIDGIGLGGSVVTISNSATLSGFTVTNGAAANGAGINIAGTANIQENIIRNNSASGYGGGIYVYSGALISDNLLESNYAPTGGGISVNRSYISATIKDNVFRSNTGGSSGLCICTNYSTVAVKNNLFEQNTTGMNLTAYSTVVADGNTYRNNGTALTIPSYSDDVVSNSLFVGNGTAISIGSYARGKLINNTITGSTVAGIYGASGCQGSCSQAINSIIWGNALDINAWVDVSYSILGAPRSGTGNIVADPLFVDAAAGNYQLQANSPAIDRGMNTSPSYGVIADHDGVARPQDGDGLGAGSTGDGSDYDIGAYEYVN